MHWPQDSVYGRRDGALTGLAVVPRERNNLFRSSPGFKSGVVHEVQMLPRAMMWKPPVIWLPIHFCCIWGYFIHSLVLYFWDMLQDIARYILIIYLPLLQDIFMLDQHRLFCWGDPKCATSRESFHRHPGAQTSFSSNFIPLFFQDFEGCNRNFPNYHAQGLSFLSTEAKVAAGTDIVKQSLRAFLPPSMSTVMLVDLMSYDAFPALAALEDSRATCK